MKLDTWIDHIHQATTSPPPAPDSGRIGRYPARQHARAHASREAPSHRAAHSGRRTRHACPLIGTSRARQTSRGTRAPENEADRSGVRGRDVYPRARGRVVQVHEDTWTLYMNQGRFEGSVRTVPKCCVPAGLKRQTTGQLAYVGSPAIAWHLKGKCRCRAYARCLQFTAFYFVVGAAWGRMPIVFARRINPTRVTRDSLRASRASEHRTSSRRHFKQCRRVGGTLVPVLKIHLNICRYR